MVGGDRARRTVEADGASVRDDPLRSGVTERHSDADDRAGVVPGDLLDDGLTLRGAQTRSFVGGWDG